ncbi:MAG: hypothetical protein RLZZ546_2137, partial [Bacteroidota bacterium]
IPTNAAKGGVINGLYITNSTYAALSMKNGDAFSKAFGGITGKDPDFFLLTIKKWNDGILQKDSINFYLADYRFSDDSKDYIIDKWTYLDLSALGRVDSLQFSLSSSDNGAFGMNTPSYFCIDEVSTADGLVKTPEIEFGVENLVFPNISCDKISLKYLIENIEIYDISGIKKYENKDAVNEIDISSFSKGEYFIVAKNEVFRFIKI